MATGDGVVVGLWWRGAPEMAQNEMFQVLRFRAGRVVDMQDYRNRAAALRAVNAPA